MMGPIDKVWKVRPVSREGAESLAAELGVSASLASVLLARGLARDASEARRFLKPDVQSVPNPFLLTDMHRAVELVQRAIAERWPILVHGDRDVDGVAATSLLYRLLKSMGADVSAYVPGEVYGIVSETFEAAAAKGVRLLITVDCGTTAHEPIRKARALGLEVIVLDHHQPEGELPPASALVNPNRADCPYEPKLLAGSGVAFKFAWALYLAQEPLFDQELVVVDLETTGLEPQSCEIVEIAAVRVRRGLEVDVFHTLLRPSRPIPQEVIAIHGIDDEAVAGSPSLDEVLPQLLHFVGSRTVVAHNAPFDAGFLHHASLRLLGQGFSNPTLCTRERARAALPTLPRYGLAALCRHLDIPAARFHRALDDARATAELHYRLLRLESRARRAEFFRLYLGDMTLGTLADVVPLLHENRVLCHYGLRQLPSDPRPGVRALCQLAAPGAARLRSRDVTFGIAPLLNAAGRAGQAELSLRLLCTESPLEANELLEAMQQLRENSRSKVEILCVELREMLSQQADLERDRVLVVCSDRHERGVTGVVANRLMDELGRPLVLLIDDGLEVRGSARSPEPLDILELLRACSAELLRFGGHRHAAGLSVVPGRVEALRQALNRAAEDRYGDRPVAAEVAVDLDLALDEVSESLYEELSLLEPFGSGNPAPVLRLQGIVPEEMRRLGRDERHLRLTLATAGGRLQALGWNFADRGLEARTGQPFDLLFRLETNLYQGQRSLRLNLLDVRRALPSGSVKENQYAAWSR
jgi:single-stranded-DNA-specific exonuclease